MAIRGIVKDATYPFIPEDQEGTKDPSVFHITVMTAHEHSIYEAQMSKRIKVRGGGKKFEFDAEAQSTMRRDVLIEHVKKIENYELEGKLIKSTVDPAKLIVMLDSLPPVYFLDVFDAIYSASDLPLANKSD